MESVDQLKLDRESTFRQEVYLQDNQGRIFLAAATEAISFNCSPKAQCCRIHSAKNDARSIATRFSLHALEWRDSDDSERVTSPKPLGADLGGVRCAAARC